MFNNPSTLCLHSHMQNKQHDLCKSMHRSISKVSLTSHDSSISYAIDVKPFQPFDMYFKLDIIFANFQKYCVIGSNINKFVCYLTQDLTTIIN